MHGVHAPIRYRIVVRGRFGDRFAAVFGGLDCETVGGETILVGNLDQAALRGVLDRLCDLGVQLVSVNPADPGDASGSAAHAALLSRPWARPSTKP